MLLKCLLLLFCAININAYYDYGQCPYPRIKNGFGRLKQRGNLVKYTCRPRFTLMGNRYATCRGGHWDLPPPICIKSGCDHIPPVENSVTQMYHSDAWILYFCFPGYTLVGSPVIYCDGTNWNATTPSCIDTPVPVQTSCNFEDPKLCGWKQDEIHDFDWIRLNRRTPSSYLLTGPQFDHTFGENGTGYYMYIESTSRDSNDKARLLSPIFDEKLIKDGCFVFYYHMFGKGIGGLRVYQKPDSMLVEQVLKYSNNGTNKYMLFEQWGNQGNMWYTGYASLLDVNEDFQIIIEGIRGRNFLSDIAIDDVSIQNGENCTNVQHYATTPIYVDAESCVGRCGLDNITRNGICECHFTCVIFDSCCADYLELCEFADAGKNQPDGTSESSLSMLPQTQKLVASTTDTTSTTIPYSSPSTLATPTTIPKKPTETITWTETTITQKPTTTAKDNFTSKVTGVKTTPTSITSITITKSIKESETKKKTLADITTPKLPTRMSTNSLQSNPTTVSLRTLKPSKVVADKKIQTKGTNGIVTAVIVFFVLGICCGLLYGSYKMRTAEGCAALARWRGRATSDPEVRFLNSDIDVNIDDD